MVVVVAVVVVAVAVAVAAVAVVAVAVAAVSGAAADGGASERASAVSIRPLWWPIPFGDAASGNVNTAVITVEAQSCCCHICCHNHIREAQERTKPLRITNRPVRIVSWNPGSP